MVEYLENGDLAIFDGLRFRLDKQTGYYLNAKTHKRLHVYVWEFFNGEVKCGCEIHHKDFNKQNNELDNLQMLTSEEHHKLHGQALTDEQRAWRRKNLVENAIPRAADWHKSENGSKWHKEHYEGMKDKLYVKRKFICENCGKQFESTQVKSRFCSGACASAARRKSGVDDVVKICERCGVEYVKNKYQKSHYCKSCLSTVRWETRRLQHGSSGDT